MSQLAERLRDRFYDSSDHPYRVMERRVDSLIGPSVLTLLDAGCGRTAPMLKKYIGRVPHLVGVELVDFRDVPEGLELHNADLAHMPLADASVDLVMSRSVFEHLADPESVYREFHRVLSPGGRVVFLTANMWDYATLAARLIPNRFHGRIVKATEGRAEEDTFPTQYRTNTRKAVEHWASLSGLKVAQFDYLSQYPNYLMFNGVLFFLGMCYEKLISKIDALRFLRGWILVTLEKPKLPS